MKKIEAKYHINVSRSEIAVFMGFFSWEGITGATLSNDMIGIQLATGNTVQLGTPDDIRNIASFISQVETRKAMA